MWDFICFKLDDESRGVFAGARSRVQAFGGEK